MIDAYYSRGCDSYELFKETEIATKDTFRKHLNQYNVIHLDISSFWMTIRGILLKRLLNISIKILSLQGIGMTDKLALSTLVALSSIALGKPVLSSLAILGEISISGTLIKVDELANSLQVCADSGAKKVLIPAISMIDYATVPPDLMTAFQIIPYQSAEDAVYKALGVE